MCMLTACDHIKQHLGMDVQADSSKNWAMLHFEKADAANPVLMPGTNVFMDPIWKKKVAWEEKDVFNPAIVVKDDKIYMLYRAQDKIGLPGGTSRIGLAVSTDGLHFTRNAEPVFYPAEDAYKKYEWQGRCSRYLLHDLYCL
jgi:predicted GH43/DUF377 family glycosyl hydrolase